MPKKLRVFLDTSALLAGLKSPTGATGTILAACFSDRALPIISTQVVEETERNIARKFPTVRAPWRAFLLLPPELIRNISLEEIEAAYNIIRTNDAPILAAALQAQPDALVTWDINHFLTDAVQQGVPFPILKPEEFLEQYLHH